LLNASKGMTTFMAHLPDTRVDARFLTRMSEITREMVHTATSIVALCGLRVRAEAGGSLVQASMSRSVLAERILKAAAEGERDPDRLRTLALTENRAAMKAAR
jgi:hypothetical protein